MSVRRWWRAKQEITPHKRPRSVGQKTIFEGLACRYDNGWKLEGRITHYELHPTKGYRRIGRQHSIKWVNDKPRYWLQGRNYAEVVRHGRDLEPLGASDFVQALALS
jgi:hypothetical protein